MEHSVCEVCLSTVACSLFCKCGQSFCATCEVKMVSNSFNPRCPSCDELLVTKLNAHLQRPSRSELQNVRVIQRTLVYVIGLAFDIANEATLIQQGFFGQYGRIRKCVVNSANPYNCSGGMSYSAYVQYTTEIGASLCIKATDGFALYERELKTTFGTTKYCTNFLKDQRCLKQDCLYLHELGSPVDTFAKIDTHQHLQAHNSVFDLLKVSVLPPDGQHVLPRAFILRPKFPSEGFLLTPVKKNRAYSMNEPRPRKNSRFGFAEDSSEEPAITPKFLEELVASTSPGQMEPTILAAQASELLKDPWANDLIRVESSNEDVLVKSV